MRHKVTTDLLYPNLWRGCVGAWAPCLGPSGTTLRDWSGRGNHGTLTNMDAATDWVVSGGKYGIDIDGTNDSVRALFPAVSYPLTMSTWMLARTTTTKAVLEVSSRSGNDGFSIYANNTTALVYGAANGTLDGGTAIIQDAWNHVAFLCRTATSRTIFVNGVEGATSATNRTPATITGVNIGAIFNFSSYTSASCILDDVLVYDRLLTEREIMTLSRRRGIAYETKRRSRGYVAAGGGFKAAWLASRNAQLIGGGSR